MPWPRRRTHDSAELYRPKDGRHLDIEVLRHVRRAGLRNVGGETRAFLRAQEHLNAGRRQGRRASRLGRVPSLFEIGSRRLRKDNRIGRGDLSQEIVQGHSPGIPDLLDRHDDPFGFGRQPAGSVAVKPTVHARPRRRKPKSSVADRRPPAC
jgi:hypothetical protein